MPVVWFQMVELPESKRSVLQQSPHLDMSIVATELHCTSLKLQLENKQMIQVSLKSASPLQSLDELRELTGCGGSENDPFIFSAGSAGTGCGPSTDTDLLQALIVKVDTGFAQQAARLSRKRKAISRTCSDMSQRALMDVLTRTGLKWDLSASMAEAMIQQVLSKPASAHESFQWLSRADADPGLLQDMGAYLQGQFCPDEVIIICVTGLKWLEYQSLELDVHLRPCRTDFVFIARFNAPDWATSGLHIHDEGLIKLLQRHILGLAELKTPEELFDKCGSCLAQGSAEHFAANAMLPLRQKLGLDVPVLLTDSHRNFIIGTDLSEHANTISATRMPDRKHAAALVKQTLAQKCTQLTKLLRGEAKADPADNIWPPGNPDAGQDGSDDDHQTDSSSEHGASQEDQAEKGSEQGCGAVSEGNNDDDVDSAPKQHGRSPSLAQIKSHNPQAALPDFGDLDAATMKHQFTTTMEDMAPGLIRAMGWVKCDE